MQQRSVMRPKAAWEALGSGCARLLDEALAATGPWLRPRHRGEPLGAKFCLTLGGSLTHRFDRAADGVPPPRCPPTAIRGLLRPGRDRVRVWARTNPRSLSSREEPCCERRSRLRKARAVGSSRRGMEIGSADEPVGSVGLVQPRSCFRASECPGRGDPPLFCSAQHHASIALHARAVACAGQGAVADHLRGRECGLDRRSDPREARLEVRGPWLAQPRGTVAGKWPVGSVDTSTACRWHRRLDLRSAGQAGTTRGSGAHRESWLDWNEQRTWSGHCFGEASRGGSAGGVIHGLDEERTRAARRCCRAVGGASECSECSRVHRGR